MMVPAPGLFSITTLWPSRSDIEPPTRRAMMSVEPPGANGTSQRSGRLGNDWAREPRALAFDDAQYPDLKGQWNRMPAGNPRFDPGKPRGLEQQAPLTPEFQARYEASLKDQAEGGQGDHIGYTCMAWGMPAMMNLYDVM